MALDGTWRLLNTDHRSAANALGAADVVMSDPPFSARVSRGARVRRRVDGAKGTSTTGLTYDAWTADDVHEFVNVWSPLCRRWFVVLCSHDFVPEYERAFRAQGRYVFAPLPAVIRGANVRLAGDGPSSWTTWIVVARPRAMQPRSGTLPGAYVGARERLAFGGAKPLWLMQALVHNYSRPGDVVCDPCAGSGTTLLAALTQGRLATGAEPDSTRYAIARDRVTAWRSSAIHLDTARPGA